MKISMENNISTDDQVVLGITSGFKYFLILILILVILLRLYFIFLFGAEQIVTEQIILFLAIFIMTFIWFIESKDRAKLLKLNVDLINAKKDILKSHLDTMKVLVAILEAKDRYTSGHCERVTEYVSKIVDFMGLDNHLKDVIKNAASIHDIGKLSIDSKILNKKGKLEDDEWEIIRKHPSVGVNILSGLDFLEEEKDIILHHHERFDGKGYPDQLKGEEIPLGARIIAVADSFDAMNSARAYRDALSENVIIDELKKGRGTQFDPEVIDSFLKLIENNNSYFFAKTEQ